MYSFSGNSAASVPIFTFITIFLLAIYIITGSVHIFPCIRIGRPILEIYKSLRWETEHFKSVLEITVAFLRIHAWEWEPYIYIGFSSALHLQCVYRCDRLLYIERLVPRIFHFPLAHQVLSRGFELMSSYICREACRDHAYNLNPAS
jgi:hypothetical protein